MNLIFSNNDQTVLMKHTFYETSWVSSYIAQSRACLEILFLTRCRNCAKSNRVVCLNMKFHNYVGDLADYKTDIVIPGIFLVFTYLHVFFKPKLELNSTKKLLTGVNS